MAKPKPARKASRSGDVHTPPPRPLSQDDEAAALAKLDAWVHGAEGDQAVLAMHTRVGEFLQLCMHRHSVVLDPMIVPYG